MGRVHVPTTHANWTSLKKTLNIYVHEIPTTTKLPGYKQNKTYDAGPPYLLGAAT